MKLQHRSYRSILSNVLAASAAFLLAFSLFTNDTQAGTTDNYGYWQTWAGLYVSTYHNQGNGNVSVRFLNTAGADHKDWVYQGNKVCENSPWLLISKDHPQNESLIKDVMAAGLVQRPVHVVMEPINGTCYLKQIRIVYRAPIQ